MELTDEDRRRAADEDDRLARALAEVEDMRAADERAHRRLLGLLAAAAAAEILLLAVLASVATWGVR